MCSVHSTKKQIVGVARVPLSQPLRPMERHDKIAAKIGAHNDTPDASVSPLLCRFSAAGMTAYPRGKTAGGRKAPRHEVAGSWAPVVQRALWGFSRGR